MGGMRLEGVPRVLDDVAFDLRPGGVHVPAGKNSSGKSPLIRILAGTPSSRSGRMEIVGAPYAPRYPKDTEAAGA